MRIAKKPSWIILNLLDLKTITSVNTSRLVAYARHEGSADTSGAAARDTGVIADGGGVGEGDAWWTGSAFGGFVDVCCREGRALVGAGDAEEGDILSSVSMEWWAVQVGVRLT